ncbi:MAG: LysR substrate-binding domain-containing protein [Candidatus Heteroscillospira sp.]|jgi:DNA-binding transcriptional LysR family regulator
MVDYRVNTFLTLYREMNYRKTAELLNMTQPGVTQHIHFLENAYNTRLFQYDGKTLSRTRSAELLKQGLERILIEEAALELSLHDTGEFRLRLGATKTIGEFVIPNMTTRFAAVPKNHLELVIDNTEVLLAMLDDRLLDFALIEGTFDKNRYDHHLFKNERFVGVCCKGHPFAGECVPLEEIFSETLVVREPGSGTRGIMEQLLQDRSFSTDSFKKVVTSNNFGTIRHFVANGLGITFAYQPIVDSDERLASFELDGISVVREFNYVYLNSHIAMEQIRRFENAQ